MKRQPSHRDVFYDRPEYQGLLDRLAANVRRLREAQGWTQKEAARRCLDLPMPVYASIERAENNSTAVTLARLMVGLGVDAQDLLAPAPMPPPRKPGRPKKPGATGGTTSGSITARESTSSATTGHPAPTEDDHPLEGPSDRGR